MPQAQQRKEQTKIGFGQLTLVEHSLCPLDRNSSLVENLVHQSEYRYSDPKGKRQTARARVFSPLGLSASDELYLWGLLALTLSQPGDRSDLVATPHWCLRQLGVVDTRSGRGGEQYRLFRDALRRLSVTSYLCDAFYDPVRSEHREMSFHFFSYNLPVGESSSRAWRLNWDRTFFELAKHGSSHLRFDLELYRSLDPASRRLFLFVSKIFHRRATLPQFDLRYLAIDVSESTRARRKKAGRANLQYIRHESTFVILATKGDHRFFEEEANLIRDIRRSPIRYAGYSISYKPGGRK